MKIPVTEFHTKVMVFAQRIIDTLPTTGHKFVAGVMLGTKSKKLHEILHGLCDEDGMVDVDVVRKMLASGLEASGDKVSFIIGDEGIGWLLKPVTVNLSADDVHSFMDSLC